MLLSAFTTALLTVMSEQKIQQHLFWTLGGLDYRRWEHVLMGVGPICGGILVMLLLARHLNILVLGETEAKTVGMPVVRYRMGFMAIASLVTATGVCISGNIGFVGLVVPHMMRLIVGPDHRRPRHSAAAGGPGGHHDGAAGGALFPLAAAQVPKPSAMKITGARRAR